MTMMKAGVVMVGLLMMLRIEFKVRVLILTSYCGVQVM